MLRPLRHKKGQMGEIVLGLTLQQLMEIVLAFIIFVAALYYASMVGNDLRIFKAKSARDLALTIETSEGSQGAVFFSYADAFGFKYGIKPNRVDVYLRDEDTSANALTYYIYPQDSQLQFLYPQNMLTRGTSERTVVSLKKSPPQFTFGQEDLSFSSSSCEKVDVSADPKTVLFLASTGDEAIRNAIKGVLPSLTNINAKYYENPDQR